jgi:RNA polymerase-binding transcription factor DksA
MESVPEPALAADVAGEVAVDGRSAVVARTVVGTEIVVPVSSSVDESQADPGSASEDETVEVDIVEVVDTVEVVEVVDTVEVVEVEIVVDAGEAEQSTGADEPVAEGGLAISYDALLAAAEQVLDDVDGALARLQDGTYGRCEVCNDGITDDRLAAVPTARTCERHLPLAHAN